jgi:hypothetical protein
MEIKVMKAIAKDDASKVKKYWIGHEQNIVPYCKDVPDVFRRTKEDELLVKYDKDYSGLTCNKLHVLDLWASAPKNNYVILDGYTHKFVEFCPEESMYMWCIYHYLDTDEVMTGGLGYYTSGKGVDKFEVFRYQVSDCKKRNEVNQALKYFIKKFSSGVSYCLLLTDDSDGPDVACLYRKNSDYIQVINNNSYVVAHKDRFHVYYRDAFEDLYELEK